VTVLLGLLLCQDTRALAGLRRQVAGGPRIASLSRFIARALGRGGGRARVAGPLPDAGRPAGAGRACAVVAPVAIRASTLRFGNVQYAQGKGDAA